MHEPVILAVDGNSLVHRSFHAQAASGQRHWAVRGLLTQLLAAVERIRPAVVVVGFDDPGRSLRRERWPAYKAHRGEKLDSLVEQLAAAVAALRALGVAVCVPEGLEADDVLASTAAFARRSGLRAVVVTSDRDAFCLIDDKTSVLRIINGGVEASPLMTADRLHLLLGVHPWQYRDFAALRGDPSDNLPGVRGIGPRTAARLLAEFGTAAAAFADPERVRARLGTGIARRMAAPGAQYAWRLNCEVMALYENVALDVRLDGGPGVLPLLADAVGEVYRSHNLTWSAAHALRVLAEMAAGAAEPAPAASDDEWRAYRSWGSRSAPAPRPIRARPRPEQLSLFG
ncbi:MAG TPA: 5'-3' exonuclease H3TH domain-containing protein [Jatrophihabitans sp.]|nr:5'-3' exonuclease H3TH domain-containing protein [Jatrophihabitans sp.]